MSPSPTTPSSAACPDRRPRNLLARLVSNYWKRRTGRPDCHELYVELPTDPSRRDFDAAVADLVAAFERLAEGRLDVHGTRRGYTVDTDLLTAAAFDDEAFERIVERFADVYPDRYRVDHVRTWPTRGGRVVRKDLLVPREPLVPPHDATDDDRTRSVRRPPR